MIFNS